MILIILLIIPVLFWLIPLSRSQGLVKDNLNRLILNFVSMFLTCLITGFLFWYLSIDVYITLSVMVSVSLAWAIVFHFISNRLK
jgi:hypothetical protein